MKLLKKYFQTKQYLQTDSDVITTGPRYSFGRRQWILPRGYCLFHSIRVDNIPSSDLQNAIEQKILEWSPYRDTGRYIVQMGNSILVWIWDFKVHLAEAEKCNAANITVLPESLLKKPEQRDLVCLSACLIGYEGQIWENGILTASHWWAEKPTDDHWSQFLLRNDCSPQNLPEISAATDFLQKPWGRSYNNLQLNLQTHEYTFVKIAAGLMILYLIWLGSTMVKVSGEISTLQKEINVKERQVDPILTNRSKAIMYREKIVKLHKITPYPKQLQIIEEVITVIPKAEIQKWEYQQGLLTIALSGDKLDPHVIIQQLEGRGIFSQVTALRGKRPGRLDISLLLNNSRNE